MLSKITGIIKDHFELLSYVVTGRGKPSDKLMKKFQIQQPDLVSTAYKVGKSKITDTGLSQQQTGFLGKLQQKSQSFFTSLCQRVITGISSAIFKESTTADKLGQKPSWKTRLKQIINKDQIKSDIKRIVNTEVWDAKVQGETDGILECKGKSTRVSIIPFSDACPKCKQMYLDSDGKPKVFILEDLMTNTGDRGAALPPCHPHCRCTLKMIGGESND